MRQPNVSIVITTHERTSQVSRAIHSALSQTVPEIEVIVVDDGSAEPFLPREWDERMRFVRLETTSGVCAARNAGMSLARGVWVIFLDDDDELLPNMVEVSLQAVEKSRLPSPIAALSGMEIVDESGVPVETRLPVTISKGGHYFLEDGGVGSFGTQNTLFAPRAVLESIGGWDEEIHSWEHDDLFLRLNAVCSVQGSSSVAYRMTAHSGPRLHDQMLACAEGMERTARKHYKTFEHHPRRHAHYLGAMGIAYLKAGKWAPAVSATTRAVLRDPRQPRLWVWWGASLAGPRALSLYRRAKRGQLLRRAGLSA